MISKEAIETLRLECKNNPAASAVFHLLASRERNRDTLMVSALTQKMKKEGFSHSKDSYRKVLSLCIKLGVSEAIVSSRGTLKGIKSPKVSLIELGKLACGEPNKTKVMKAIETSTGIELKALRGVNVSIKNKPVNIQFPEGITVEELSTILNSLKQTA